MKKLIVLSLFVSLGVSAGEAELADAMLHSVTTAQEGPTMQTILGSRLSEKDFLTAVPMVTNMAMASKCDPKVNKENRDFKVVVKDLAGHHYETPLGSCEGLGKS